MLADGTSAEIDERRPGTVPCPICGLAMHVERKEKVEVDVCAQHGIWLDKGRIEEITKAIERRSRVFAGARERFAVARAKQDGRVQGATFGWLSFLFD
jgi:Zn-finger nucleic acid-binding protein